MKTGIMLFAVAAITVCNIHAQTALIDLVGAERAAALVRGDKLNNTQYKNVSPALAPKNASVRNKADGLIRDLNPGFIAENLSVYKKPGTAGWSEAEKTALYNETLALSSLAGLQYFSPSRKKWRIFYETSAVVSGSDGKKAIPDPVYAVPPPELGIYVRQKDLSFGDNVYRYTYYTQPDSFVFVQENLTAMNYGLVPAVGKNNLRSMVAVIDAKEYLLIYVISMAKAAPVPGMGERVGQSFSSRADALLKWFSDQAGKAYAKLRN